MRNVTKVPLFAAILVTSLLTLEQNSGQGNKRDSYAAVVIGTGGAIGGRTLDLNINIDTYTSDQQLQEYLMLLQEEGQDALRRVLEKTTVGRIAPVAKTGTDIAIARLHATEEGKVIRLVTARSVSFFEAYRSGRSMDYPFTIMELRLDNEGKGEGSIMGGARLRFEKGQLDIESFGNQYAKLVNIRSWK